MKLDLKGYLREEIARRKKEGRKTPLVVEGKYWKFSIHAQKKDAKIFDVSNMTRKEVDALIKDIDKSLNI